MVALVVEGVAEARAVADELPLRSMRFSVEELRWLGIAAGFAVEDNCEERSRLVELVCRGLGRVCATRVEF